MDYESHIGDYTQNIAFVPFIKRYRLIVAGGHENFRAGTLAHILLLLVERILYGLYGLDRCSGVNVFIYNSLNIVAHHLGGIRVRSVTYHFYRSVAVFLTFLIEVPLEADNRL